MIVVVQVEFDAVTVPPESICNILCGTTHILKDDSSHLSHAMGHNASDVDAQMVVGVGVGVSVGNKMGVGAGVIIGVGEIVGSGTIVAIGLSVSSSPAIEKRTLAIPNSSESDV